MPRRIHFPDLILAVVGGGLLWLCSPGAPRPLSGLLALAALAPLALLVRDGQRAARVWLHAWLMGALYHGLADRFLLLNFAPFYPFVVAAAAALMATAAVLANRLARRLPLPVAVALAWAALEWLRSHLPEVPYPHHQLAHALCRQRWLAGSAAFWGEPGVHLVLGFVAGSLADLGTGWREGRPAFRRALVQGGAAAALLAGTALLAAAALGGIETRPGPRVALVQAFRPERAQPPHRNTLLADLLEWSAREAPGEVDLLAWSETVLPAPLLQGAESVETLGGERLEAAVLREWEEAVVSRALGAASLAPGGGFVAGALLYEGGGSGAVKPLSVAALWDRQGRRAGHVAKGRLVPGGEFLPFLRHLPAPLGEGSERTFLEMGGAALRAGGAPFTLALPATGRFGVAICYDNAFPERFRRATREGAEWHLVLSYEAWYGRGAELDQMVAMTVFRALETRRAVARCTYSGVTCLVEPDGRVGPVLERGGSDREVGGVLTVEIPRAGGWTWAVRAGSWPGLGILALTCLLSLPRPWRRRRPAAG